MNTGTRAQLTVPEAGTGEGLVLALPGAILLSGPAGQFVLRSTVSQAQTALDPVVLLGVEDGSPGELAGLALTSR